jgi:hypothetical protein
VAGYARHHFIQDFYLSAYASKGYETIHQFLERGRMTVTPEWLAFMDAVAVAKTTNEIDTKLARLPNHLRTPDILVDAIAVAAGRHRLDSVKFLAAQLNQFHAGNMFSPIVRAAATVREFGRRELMARLMHDGLPGRIVTDRDREDLELSLSSVPVGVIVTEKDRWECRFLMYGYNQLLDKLNQELDSLVSVNEALASAIQTAQRAKLTSVSAILSKVHATLGRM